MEFIAARVQDVIDSVLKRAKENGSEIVAVLDPPRSGLRKFSPFDLSIAIIYRLTTYLRLAADVIKSIRRCEDIKRLVYVACDLDQSMNNIIEYVFPYSRSQRRL